MLLLHGDPAPGFTLFGYDMPRLHAAVNDLPAALLVAAVLFELLHLVTRRESLRSAGFWTLIAGTVGAGLAVLSGLQAEDAIDHGEAIHEIMEQHETLAYITLGIFGVLMLWRLLRESRMGRPERIGALLLGLAGCGVLVWTAQEGGEMVFDHAAGTPTAVLEEEIRNRAAGHQHGEGGGESQNHGPAADSAAHQHD